ncbi:MAG TPA: flagellar biosynthetic protein FliO [bacterium]|nr:flagellar biosynthetic protein FliO [bacterium]
MAKFNSNKKDRIRSYFVALLFLVVAAIGIWMAFSKNSEPQSEGQVQKAQSSYADTVSAQEQTTPSRKDTSLIKYRQSSDEYSGGIIKTIVISALFIIFLIAGIILFRKKFKSSRAFGMDMEILGKKYFGQKQFLIMVKIEGKKLLLGVTDQSIHLIKEFEVDEDDENNYKQPNKPDQNFQKFPNILKRINFNKD